MNRLSMTAIYTLFVFMAATAHAAGPAAKKSGQSNYDGYKFEQYPNSTCHLPCECPPTNEYECSEISAQAPAASCCVGGQVRTLTVHCLCNIGIYTVDHNATGETSITSCIDEKCSKVMAYCKRTLVEEYNRQHGTKLNWVEQNCWADTSCTEGYKECQ